MCCSQCKKLKEKLEYAAQAAYDEMKPYGENIAMQAFHAVKTLLREALSSVMK